MPQTHSFKLLAFAAALTIIAPVAANAATAVAKRPTSIYAAPNTDAKVLGLIGVSQVVDTKTCKNGWCRVGGGYVRSSYLRFIPVRKGYENGYDYNVPLALPPYGYVPGFWGYGGRRYYDRYGNYTKYGERGNAGTEKDRLGGTVETRPGRRFGVR